MSKLASINKNIDFRNWHSDESYVSDKKFWALVLIWLTKFSRFYYWYEEMINAKVQQKISNLLQSKAKLAVLGSTEKVGLTVGFLDWNLFHKSSMKIRIRFVSDSFLVVPNRVRARNIKVDGILQSKSAWKFSSVITFLVIIKKKPKTAVTVASQRAKERRKKREKFSHIEEEVDWRSVKFRMNLWGHQFSKIATKILPYQTNKDSKRFLFVNFWWV